MRKRIILLGLVIFLIAGSSWFFVHQNAVPIYNSPTWRKAQEEAIYEAALRYRFAHDPNLKGKGPFYLVFAGSDPSDATLQRLVHDGFNVKRGAAKAKAGEKARYAGFYGLKWISDYEVDAEWQYYYSQMMAGGMSCHVVYRNGHWVGERIFRRWIS
jgi:hypothetical protein